MSARELGLSESDLPICQRIAKQHGCPSSSANHALRWLYLQDKSIPDTWPGVEWLEACNTLQRQRFSLQVYQACLEVSDSTKATGLRVKGQYEPPGLRVCCSQTVKTTLASLDAYTLRRTKTRLDQGAPRNLAWATEAQSHPILSVQPCSKPTSHRQRRPEDFSIQTPHAVYSLLSSAPSSSSGDRSSPHSP